MKDITFGSNAQNVPHSNLDVPHSNLDLPQSNLDLPNSNLDVPHSNLETGLNHSCFMMTLFN